jgi:hypothetical protein
MSGSSRRNAVAPLDALRRSGDSPSTRAPPMPPPPAATGLYAATALATPAPRNVIRKYNRIKKASKKAGASAARGSSP